jgi:hypothetical protein
VLIVAMSCFGTGVVVGLVAPDVVNAVSAERDWDADEDFVRRYIKELALTPDQADKLRMILAAREQEEIASIKSFGAQNLPDGLRTLLNQAGDRADDRIQVVLSEEQRERFKELKDQEGDRWPNP